MTLHRSNRIPEPGDPKMPFPLSCPALADLPQIPAKEIAALPADMLAALQFEADESFKHIKAIKARLDGALTLKYSDLAAEARRLAGKGKLDQKSVRGTDFRTYGTVRLKDGAITVVADLSKRVDWDQEKLGQMVERIRAAGDDPAEYVEISFKVSERKYVAWPEAIRQGFEPARTVRTGQLGIQLLADEAEQ